MTALTQLARDYRAAWHNHVHSSSENAAALDHYQATVKPLENAIIAHPYPVTSSDDLLQLALIMSDELADLSNSMMTLRIVEMVQAYAEARGADRPDPIASLIAAYDAALNYAEEVSRGAEDMSDADYAELSAKTHLPLREALINSTEAATTEEGARAALDLARREYAIGDTPLIPRMLDAAAGYFDQEPCRTMDASVTRAG